MSNPFDNAGHSDRLDTTGSGEVEAYHVLANDEGQHSLWPAFAPVPSGWTCVHRAESRQSCLRHLDDGFDGGEQA